ncbi:hypothetical protein REPUB_Repub18cG0018500 [Reevesia pubescens]
MEHIIQHETLPLKDEKQFIREIKQLKQSRERLLSNIGRQHEVQQGLNQKDQIEERLKSLKKETDQLKVDLLKAEAVTKAAKKKYHDETEKSNKLLYQFKAADEVRQEAYAQLQSLKKQSNEKGLCKDSKCSFERGQRGNSKSVLAKSTLRRLRTLDGHGLGPDEEPPVIPQVVSEIVVKDHTVSSSTLVHRTQEKVVLAKAEKANDKPAAKAVEQKNQTSKSEKSVKSVPPASGSTIASGRDRIEEAGEETPKRTKEEKEVVRKAEELRKEKEAAKREQLQLEEIAKAKEALERKRRIAEKAQARAALRAQKEAEQKEKETEKMARNNERRKVAAAAAGDASITDVIGCAPTSKLQLKLQKNLKIKRNM